jgi:poly(hydroxyalkanoate) granule-associated protein
VKDSAQQIWLAGLGAFAKAQAEGGKMFEALVKDGLNLQRKTQTVAEEKISETTSRLSDMASGLTSGMASKATGITSMATGQWDKLENIFEDRVAKALNKLGVPSSKEVAALTARVDALTQALQNASKKAAAPAKTVRPAAKPTAVKAKVSATAKPASKAVAKPAVKRARKAVAPQAPTAA